MSEEKKALSTGEKIEEENDKINTMIEKLQKEGKGIQVPPHMDANMQMSSLIEILAEKGVFELEEYAYKLVKTRREFVEKAIADSDEQSKSKLILPKGGLITPQ